MAIMEICAKCGEEYNSDKWVNGAGTCQDCACDALELENAVLRARVEKLEGELAREREDARDIPTIAYMSGAADWKARATRAEAQLPTRERELLDTLNMLLGARAELASVREASALLVGQEIARADKAEARVEKLEEQLVEAVAELIYLRKHGADGAVWIANESKDVWRGMAQAALAECEEVERG